MLLRRIVLLYIVLLLCRIVFYCYNYGPDRTPWVGRRS